MNDYDKTKETLIRELEELRQRVRFLENEMYEKNYEGKEGYEGHSGKLSKTELWRLPGYWH
jgi:hypothetical protein